MRKIRVKICGITKKRDLIAVSNSGADAVGLVVGVPSSPRNLSLEEAERLIRLVPVFLKSVVVTAPKNICELTATYERLLPDGIQIHTDKQCEVSILREKLPNTFLIKAINANSANPLEEAIEASQSFDAILLDTASPGKYGGTGIIHDWGLSQRVCRAIYPKPLILAGGLNPENVEVAIRRVKPYAVDVSTGVEMRPGIKDLKKILTFVQNVKQLNISDDHTHKWGVDL